jgi:hypothetical protein
VLWEKLLGGVGVMVGVCVTLTDGTISIKELQFGFSKTDPFVHSTGSIVVPISSVYSQLPIFIISHVNK